MSRRAVRSPVTFSLLFAFALAAAIVAVTGGDPLAAGGEMFTGAVTGSGVGSTVARAGAIMRRRLTVSIACRSCIINLE